MMVGCSPSNVTVDAGRSGPRLSPDMIKGLRVVDVPLSLSVYVDDATTPIVIDGVAVIDFSAGAIERPLPDNDNDGVSNLSELIAGTDPGQAPPTLPAQFDVGVNVIGLAGSVILQNGPDELTVTQDGPYTISTRVSDGTDCHVVVKTQPADQTCTPSLNRGRIKGANATNIDVRCDTTPMYRVGVFVTGLSTGGSLTLQDNGADDLVVSTTGSSTFASALRSGALYGVSVAVHPTGQRCIVINSSDVVANTDVSPVGVECYAAPSAGFTLGGSVTDPKGMLVLKVASTLNASNREELVIRRSGPFTFTLPLASADHYTVTVHKAPTGQQCNIANDDGVARSDVSDVRVTCRDALAVDAVPLSREVELTWDSSDASRYNLYLSTRANCDVTNYSTCANGRMLTSVASPLVIPNLTNEQILFLRRSAV